MKIIIPGGSGQVGTLLARAFYAEGHEVVVLSRTPQTAPWRVVSWDGETVGGWAGEVDGADAVIVLAGRSVNCRYTPENRRAIIDSRVRSTRAVGEAVARSARPPGVWLQASTATIYSHRYDAPNDDVSGVLGGAEPGLPETWRFSLDVARQWEAEFDRATVPHTRKVLLRSAIVMSADRGGAFDTLLGLVRHGLGGPEGDGRQYVSWIHGQDFVRAVRFLLEGGLTGAVILAAPGPLPNAAFLRALRDAADVRAGLPATKWMLEIGARPGDGDRVDPEEPPRRAAPLDRGGLHVRVPRLALGRPGPVPPGARGALRPAFLVFPCGMRLQPRDTLLRGLATPVSSEVWGVSAWFNPSTALRPRPSAWAASPQR